MTPIFFVRKIFVSANKVFSKQEKILAGFISLIILVSGFFVLFPGSHSARVDGDLPIQGGSVIEGMIGRPQTINPLFAKSEIDKSLSSLIFAGLMRTNEKQEVVPHLAQKFDVSEDKKTYTVSLRPGLTWHDGSPVTAEDVIYTVAVIKNPDYTGSLKETWDGIRVEKVDDLTVRFVLPRAYPLFLNALTVGLIPHHLWVDVAVKDFTSYPLNNRPIGAGPYKIERISQDKDSRPTVMELVAFDRYQPKPANISRFDIRFYDTKERLLSGLERREISSVGLFSFDDELAGSEIRGFINHNVGLPQYVGLFFNLKKPGGSILSDRAVREAVAYGLDKTDLNMAANFSSGEVVDSPILKGYLGASDDFKKYSHDTKISQSLLSQSGWNDIDGNGVREKDGVELSLLLAIPQDPQFVRVADELSDQMEMIGIRLDVRKVDAATFEQEYLSTRSYDMVIIGENIGLDADPYSYWHSSQINFPGLNLSMFENGEVDKLLEEARQTSDTNLKIRNYEKFQQIIADELPAVILYRPIYVYKVSSQVKGVDVAGIVNTWDRFSGAENWYINKR